MHASSSSKCYPTSFLGVSSTLWHGGGANPQFCTQEESSLTLLGIPSHELTFLTKQKSRAHNRLRKFKPLLVSCISDRVTFLAWQDTLIVHNIPLPTFPTFHHIITHSHQELHVWKERKKEIQLSTAPLRWMVHKGLCVISSENFLVS